MKILTQADRRASASIRCFKRNGKRFNAARAYLGKAPYPPNLEVMTEAQVEGVVFEGRRAVGVKLNRAGGQQIIRARREVILSAGAIGSPHLLMLSGIGPSEHLRSEGIEVLHDAPEVGGNLQIMLITPPMFFRILMGWWAIRPRHWRGP